MESNLLDRNIKGPRRLIKNVLMRRRFFDYGSPAEDWRFRRGRRIEYCTTKNFHIPELFESL